MVLTSFVVLGPVSAKENFQQIDRSLEIAFQHARNYPPVFDSETQRENLERELLALIAQLEQMLKNTGESQQILFRLGKAHTFAYNLDIPKSREKADECFAKLFKLNPNHVEGHLYYGQHLSGRGEFKSAIEHLQVAADAGLDVALGMIGMAYLQMDNKDEARAYFQKLRKKHPEDRQAQMLLDSLESSSEYQYKNVS